MPHWANNRLAKVAGTEFGSCEKGAGDDDALSRLVGRRLSAATRRDRLFFVGASTTSGRLFNISAGDLRLVGRDDV